MKQMFAFVMVLAGTLNASMAQENLPTGAIARVGTIQLRHQSPVHQLTFLADGNVAALDIQGHFRVWDGKTGNELRSFHQRPSQAGNDFDHMFRMELMMREMGRMGRRVHYGGRNGMGFALQSFSADGRLLAGAEGDKIVVREMKSGSVVKQLSLRMPAAADPRMARWMRHGRGGEISFHPVAFSTDGRLVAAGSGYGTGVIQVFDLITGKEVHALRVPLHSPISRLRFFPGATHLLGHNEQQGMVWDLKTGKRIRTYQSGEGMLALTLSPDGKQLASADGNNKITLWEDESEDEQGVFESGERMITTLAITPDGKTLLAGGFEHSLRIYDLSTKKEVKKIEGHEGSITALVISNDGKTAAAAEDSGRIRLWDLTQHKEKIILESDGPVSFAAVTGTKATLAGPTGAVREADLLTGKVTRRFKKPGSHMGAISSDGKLMLVRGDEREGAVRLWDVVKGEELRELKGIGDIFSSAIFSPDNKRLALCIGEESHLQVWNVTTGEMVFALEKMAEPLAFTADGRSLLAVSQGTQLAVWELASGKARFRFPWSSGRGAERTLVSPDGRLLACANSELIALWDMVSGKVIRALAGHTSEVTMLGWSRDGTRLASGANDGSVRLWDVTQGKTLRAYEGHRGVVSALSFTADGKLLVSGSHDGTALVWDLEAPQSFKTDAKLAKLESLWADLSQEDAELAYTAQKGMLTSPEETVKLLSRVIKPATVLPPEQMRKLIAELDDRRFATRERAMQELRKLRGAAGPALKQAKELKPSKEVLTRIQTLLDEIAKPSSGNEELRGLRAVEVLEKINTATSRQLLEQLAGGATGARLTDEAIAARDRLNPRPEPNSKE